MVRYWVIQICSVLASQRMSIESLDNEEFQKIMVSAFLIVRLRIGRYWYFILHLSKYYIRFLED